MYYVGVDLGRQRDHSALVVLELVREEMLVRYAERVPLGTPYPKVVERVRTMTSHDAVWGQCVAVVDATGVGAPVVDMMKNARLGCELVAVTITGGDREAETASGWNVPKKDLIAGVQLALERGELRIAKGMQEAGSLMRELGDMRADRRESGRTRIGAEGTDEHDDLAIALALAVWRASKKPPKKWDFYGNRRLI